MVIFIMKLFYLHQLVYMKLAYKTCCTEDKQKKNQVLPLNCTVYNRCMLYKIFFHECLKCQYRHIEFERIFSAYNSKCMILEGK